ncbi:hypothetical protein SAMD00019534_120980 [Acytostelium subglobosum LB1]|uniref:hypothetical protein n=1 Tax=Acytostelium subglobosum LB1 TaxID=1410327 RepID=UPI0006447E4B|nr:hypothetical protein SAMD00019534_120980 [Acytostelium subglobosum LB1]GAM28922.1 hypothetical protein SAMD00019534_120980 [Acytostelium subglobosum LB1]|eukprot:XP_012748107.1 hypothetical protein SAMD00019534_120980 [Acytostelium subglobosum LB1]
MNIKLIIISTLVVLCAAHVTFGANLDSFPFDLTQTKTATWNDGEKTFSTFDCQLINLSTQTVSLTEITASKAPVAVWGALSYSATTKFPVQSWAQSISPNGTVNFGYLVDCAGAISWSWCNHNDV